MTEEGAATPPYRQKRRMADDLTTKQKVVGLNRQTHRTGGATRREDPMPAGRGIGKERADR